MGADGAPDDVQRVYYLWALQQDRTGFVSNDGKHYPPRWQVRALCHAARFCHGVTNPSSSF